MWSSCPFFTRDFYFFSHCSVNMIGLPLVLVFLSCLNLVQCLPTQGSLLQSNTTHSHAPKELQVDSISSYTGEGDSALKIAANGRTEPVKFMSSTQEETVTRHQWTWSWAVRLKPNCRKGLYDQHRLANHISDELSLQNLGQVGLLEDHFLLVHEEYHKTMEMLEHKMEHGRRITAALRGHPCVEWSEQQRIHRRVKRDIELNFQDPYYSLQWHLHNQFHSKMDLNVLNVWKKNITGSGVTVAVIDDGIEWTNPDLQDNYSPEGSFDLNSNDPDPMPEFDTKGQNHHGTRCAGEIAAVANSVCAVGVAFHAKISGIKILDGPMTDNLEAAAFNKNMHINDVYSCSWGPDDDGKTIDGPHYLARKALLYGVTGGRQGYGSIFVVASGNGGSAGDNCNYDGYANSIYTVTIGAVDEAGGIPYYAESCSSMLAVTFSSGDAFHKGIVTTDWQMGKGTGCTTGHSGTSAAAPLAAGMVALMLEVRPCLTWRDVQHIIVLTAKLINEQSSEWTVNAAGFYHSHQHGFGLMDAWRLVNAAKVWEPVSWLMSLNSPTLQEDYVFTGGHTVKFYYNVTKQDADIHFLYSLEYVLVTVSISHSSRGNLELKLVCPSGTKSVIAAPRSKDKSKDGIKEWTFSTVRCWGEAAVGIWELLITDHGNPGEGWGKLEKWKLTLYGSSLTPANIQARREMVEDAMDGRFLNSNLSAPCPPPEPPAYDETKAIRVKTLKILVLTGGMTVLLALYYTVEQAFLNKEDKEGVPPPINPAPEGCPRETDRLIPQQDTAEEIPMQTLPLTETLPNNTANTEEPVDSNDTADNSPALERQPLLSSRCDVQIQELPGTTTEDSSHASLMSETYQNEMWSVRDEDVLNVSCQMNHSSIADGTAVLELESSEKDWEEQPLLAVDQEASNITQSGDKCVLPVSEETTVDLMVGQQPSRTSGGVADRSDEDTSSSEQSARHSL
ncbi:proprotein convertase subtilisin/kexin type 7-like [Branchiostoma floridae]|uniref:Proprotein convertase subtilisin/kexin type 7-like n=1 Tax=Branchiostoma floridae TaxID=7739 RepID=A0A9J7MTV3_BRAFL|nr:proprotein convertase subtilisin/kexin type 7-like [Branchiostoma floridae]